MNRSLPIIVFGTCFLSLSPANATVTQATASCSTHPTYGFNGRVKIPYPSGRGMASVVQFCSAADTRFKQSVMRQARAAGLDVRWTEYYRAKEWVSAFHDSIYQTRALGFQQSNYKQFSVQEWKDTETLVYSNSSGKYVGMLSRRVPGTTNTSEFLLYGN